LSIDYWLSGTTAKLIVTEFYPPIWRGILETGSVYFPSRHLGLTARNGQRTVFRCKNGDGPLDFAVMLDYTYNRSSRQNPEQIKPIDIQHHAAFIGQNMALAELMMDDNITTQWMLEWQESLDFGNEERGITFYIYILMLIFMHNETDLSRRKQIPYLPYPIPSRNLYIKCYHKTFYSFYP
jgi:hypothetical protein